MAYKSHSYSPGDVLEMELYIKGQLFRSVEVGTTIPFWLGCLVLPQNVAKVSLWHIDLQIFLSLWLVNTQK